MGILFKRLLHPISVSAIFVVALAGTYLYKPDIVSAPTLQVLSNIHEPRAVALIPVRILFLGDIMLDRSVAVRAKAVGYDALTTKVESMFTSADATVANLEGTITTNPSISQVDHTKLQFTFNPAAVPFLQHIGITAVSLSNNHALDFGRSGYRATKEFLKQGNIIAFGSPYNFDNPSTKFTIRGRNICFVGYEGAYTFNASSTEREIARLRPSCDLLIATMHAGVEYDTGHTSEQRRVARAFIDAGADAIIGTHPHVVEPLEIYKGKAIFYSLGNFIFDQNFSFGTTHGLAVYMEWNENETAYELVPITIRGQEATFSDNDEGLKTRSALIDRELPNDISGAILNTSSFTLK